MAATTCPGLLKTLSLLFHALEEEISPLKHQHPYEIEKVQDTIPKRVGMDDMMDGNHSGYSTPA